MSFWKTNGNAKQGGRGERAIGLYLEDQGHLVWDFNDDSRYDILTSLDGKMYFIELKTDRYFLKNKTDNLFIETRCNNKPSGIWSSKADWFYYFFPDTEELFITRIEDLRSALSSRSELFRYVSGGGDGGRASGFVISKTDAEQVFQKIKVSVFYWNLTAN